MSDTSFTLVELHLGDGDVSIGPLGLVAGTSDGGDEPVDAEEEESAGSRDGDASAGGCRGKRIAGLLLALGALAAVAVAVAKLRGDDAAVPSGIAGDD